jgi:hypothetical protein
LLRQLQEGLQKVKKFASSAPSRRKKIRSLLCQLQVGFAKVKKFASSAPKRLLTNKKFALSAPGRLCKS